MVSVSDVSQPSAVGGVRVALVVAVAGSAMAASVHAAAVSGHAGDPTLVWLFSLCAAGQLVWAAAAALRPTRLVLAVGLVVNGGALLVWSLAHTVGISFVGSLAEPEVAGTQDVAAAAFAVASVIASLRILVRPVVRHLITPAWTGVLAAIALVIALPAAAAGPSGGHGDHADVETAGAEHAHSDGEDHGGAEQAHADGADHGSTTGGHEGADHATGDDPVHQTGADHATGDDPPHQTGADHATGDAHAEGGPGSDNPGGSGDHAVHPPTTSPPTTGGGHGGHPEDPEDPEDPAPTGRIISLDDPRLTAAQRATATKLIDEARTALSAFPNVAALEAAGYISIGDGGTNGFEHYVKWSYLFDAYELDPAHIESIVVKKNGTAAKTIVSAMYILNPGKTMADVPPLAGELTTWHEHGDLCFEGTTLVGLASGGVCARGVLTPTPPMLHVWMIERPCGPFAGIDDSAATCGAHEEH